jgi:tyrosine-protein kinase Etk/Wzc
LRYNTKKPEQLDFFFFYEFVCFRNVANTHSCREARVENRGTVMQTVDPDHDLLVASESGELTPPGLQEDEQVSLLDLLIVLGQRKVFLIRSTLVVAVLAVIFCLVFPNRYTATASILPPQQNSSLGATLLSQVGSLGSLGALAGGSLGLGSLKNPNDLAIALLKSRSVEEAMVQRFDLKKLYREKRMSDARKALEEHSDIESNVKDGLIRISVTDRDPRRAAEMTNAYVDEYKKFSANLAVTEASQRRLFFEQQLEQAKNKLGVAEEAMKTTEQTTGMIQLDSQAKALIESVATLRAQVAAKEVQIRGMSLFATADNPDLLVAKEQLVELQRQLKQLGGSQAGVDSDLIVPRGKLPQAGMDYIRKLRDVRYNELIFELLAKQFEIAKLDEAREGAVTQVVDSAVPPDRKSFPRLSIIGPAVTLSWLMLAILWVYFRHGMERAQDRPHDRERLQVLKAVWRKSFLKS